MYDVVTLNRSGEEMKDQKHRREPDNGNPGDVSWANGEDVRLELLLKMVGKRREAPVPDVDAEWPAKRCAHRHVCVPYVRG